MLEHKVRRNIAECHRILKSHLVERECARFIRAQHIHGSKLLDRCQSGDDSFLLGQLATSDGHRRRADNLNGNGDRCDQEDNALAECLERFVVGSDEHAKDHAHGDERGHHKNESDASENALKIAFI